MRCPSLGLLLLGTLIPWRTATAQAACPPLTDSSAATLLATDARLWSPRDAAKEPTNPNVLRDLACTRWALWRTEVIARERPGKASGSSWLEGAATVAWMGLAAPTVAPEVAAVAAALAAAEPLTLTREKRFVAVWKARPRAKQPQTALSLDRACIALGERLPDHAERVLTCAQAGAAADPANAEWHLAEAHALARLADTAGAWTAWRAALKRSRSAADWERITEEVRWFATPAEVTALEATPLAEREQAVIQLFDQRDLRTGSPRGTYFTTFVTRLTRAREEFGLRIPRSQAQRFLTGAPSPGGLGKPKLDSEGLGNTDWRELVRWQTEIDDRGIIFVRHGEPDIRNTPATLGATFELWFYTRTMPPLLFQFEEEDFDGSVAPTRVTAGRINEHWCGINVYRCLIALRAPLMSPAALLELKARLREEDRQIITAAMSTDTPEERGEPLPPLLARAHRLWDPVSGEPILLVAYALPWPVPRAADPPLDVELRLAWWGTTQRDTTLARQHTPPPERAQGAQGGGRGPRHAVGFVTLPRDTTTTSWRMQAVTDNTTRQAIGSGMRIGQREGVTLSDLVIGNDESPLRWSVRGEQVAVDAGATLRADLPISVFYQIRSEGATRTITSRFRVTRLGARAGERADLIDVSLTSELEPGLQQIAPTLDPRFLTPGDYGLELRVLSEDGVELAVATTSFRIGEQQ
jgi:hypothetical protein